MLNHLLQKYRRLKVQVKHAKLSDELSLAKWLKLHNKKVINGAPLAQTAFVVPGVAYATLRYIDGGGYIMEGLITNPLCSSATRNSALNSLYAAITKSYSPLLAWSEDAGAIQRAISVGFKPLSGQLLLVYNRKDT